MHTFLFHSDCGYRNEDLVFGLAISSMTTEANFIEMKNIVKNAIHRSDIDSGDMRVGIFVFSTQVYTVIYLSDYNTSSDLKAAVDGIPYNAADDRSELAAGLIQLFDMFSVTEGDRPTIPNYAFVLLDDHVKFDGTLDVANQLRNVDIHLDFIALEFSSSSELSPLGYLPENHVFMVDSFDMVKYMLEFVVWKDSTCSKYWYYNKWKLTFKSKNWIGLSLIEFKWAKCRKYTHSLLWNI